MIEKMTRQYAEYLINRVSDIDEIGDKLAEIHRSSQNIPGNENITRELKDVFGRLGELSFRIVNSVITDYPELNPDQKHDTDN